MSKHQIKSPVPGTFYRRPAPDQPPFKEVGDSVAEGDTVGLVEVMKSFHEIPSDSSGKVSSFPLEDAQPVMAGQVICELE